MVADRELDQAIAAIADGARVDWNRLAEGTQNAEDEELLACLRIVSDVAQGHRGLDDPLAVAPVVSDADRYAANEQTGSFTAAELMWSRYRLLEKVGEGSFGIVYRAWDTQLERETAVKLLHTPLATSDLRDRILREGRTLARIRHPNVVDVFNVEAHEGRVGLCMEFVRGDTLEDVLRVQGPFSAREATLVGQDVCRALAAVHAAGFIHRDVNARNVMREHAGRIVLMDFGTGLQAERLAASAGEWAGTPLYMAPEVLSGAGASATSDVYSVGVLLFHLVSGKYPVEGRTVDELRVAHAKGRRRFLSDLRPDLPAPFIQVVEQATAHNRTDRPPGAGALLSALTASLGTDGSAEGTVTARARLRRAVRSPEAMAVLVAFVLGFISTTAYNNVVRGSASLEWEPLWKLFEYGVRSVVAPFLLLVLFILLFTVLGFLRAVLTRLSATVRRIDSAFVRQTLFLTNRLGLDEPANLASAIVFLSAVALIVAWWYFAPLRAAMTTPISEAPAASLVLLGPAHASHQDAYRMTFSAIVILTAAAWHGVFRFARNRRRPVPRMTLASGATVLGLAFVLLDFPYRLLMHNEATVVRLGGDKCYNIGDGAQDVLLFCPALPPPRRVVVRRDDPRLETTALRESIFTEFK